MMHYVKITMSRSLVDHSRVKNMMNEQGISQAEMARRVGITQPTINRIVNGEALGSSHLHKIARILGTTPSYLTGETDDPDMGAIPPPSQELIADQLGLVPVREIDLTFGMGSTYLDVPVTEEVRYFSHDWIRIYTRASPDHLLFAQGIGDSMAPTILDSDLLLIDCSQTSINMGDKIWAISFAEIGMVKRLRAMPDGSVKIMSDNPQVLPETAVDGEMSVLGRVVAVVRKV